MIRIDFNVGMDSKKKISEEEELTCECQSDDLRVRKEREL